MILYITITLIQVVADKPFFQKLIEIIPELLGGAALVVITKSYTEWSERKKNKANLEKLITDLDGSKIDNYIKFQNFNLEKMESLSLKNEKLEKALERAHESRLEMEKAFEQVVKDLDAAKKEAMEFRAAYNIYKNYKI